MQRNKRTGCKQNNLNKKVQLTLPCHLQTEEGLKYPSLSILQQKSLNKTTERIKTLNQTKKSISLKSTNKTLQASFCGQSPNINKLLQQLRESKASLELASKSPKSHTSKIQQRSKANKPAQAECYPRSGKKLGKLQRTIQKLDLAKLLADELSEMALVSASSQSVRRRERTPLIEIQDDEINFSELRQFCQDSGMKVVQAKLTGQCLFREQMAACKIQRAWKKYRTRMIITRYARIISSRSSSSRLSEYGAFFCPDHQELLLSSEDLYDKTSDIRHNRQISDLSGGLVEPRRSQYEEEVERVRREQLERWEEVIRIINSTNHADPLKIQELFAQILLKYENTKKSLFQSKQAPRTLNNNSEDSPRSIDQDGRGAIEASQAALRVLEAQRPSPQSKSQNSVEMDGYNCSKYVRNFDCDFFPPEQRSQSGISLFPPPNQFQRCKISKVQQDELLQGLQPNKNSTLGPGRSDYSSASVLSHRRQASESLHKIAFARSSIRRVLSQKVISLFPDQSREVQTAEAAEKDYYQFTFPEGAPGRQFAAIGQEQAVSEEQSAFLVRPAPSMQFYEPAAREPKPSFFKLNTIQQEEECGEEAQLAAAQNQLLCDEERVKQIAVLVLNTLTLQTLKDISRSEPVTRQFKKYAHSSRLRIRTGSLGGRKKGFPTDKKEVESFLESMISYIETYEPAIFLNLQVATGPSALEMLRFMHEQQREESFEVCENSQSEASIMVVPNRVFELFWQLKEKSIIVEVPENFDRSDMVLFRQNLDYLKSFNKIFYRSLFDTLNECLDCHRNFGQRGMPFPWKNTPSFTHQLSNGKISREVSQARKRMVEVATTYCGLIIDKEEMEELGGSEEYVAQLQEDRLSRMLASDLVEWEHKWTFYDDEEAELLIELSSFVFGCLVLESISEIYALGRVWRTQL